MQTHVSKARNCFVGLVSHTDCGPAPSSATCLSHTHKAWQARHVVGPNSRQQPPCANDITEFGPDIPVTDRARKTQTRETRQTNLPTSPPSGYTISANGLFSHPNPLIHIPQANPSLNPPFRPKLRNYAAGRIIFDFSLDPLVDQKPRHYSTTCLFLSNSPTASMRCKTRTDMFVASSVQPVNIHIYLVTVTVVRAC
jgi:hypothetical protein